MKQIKFFTFLVVCFLLLHSCDKEEDVLFEQSTAKIQQEGFELVPFDKVLNSLNNPYIKKNLAELKEKALLSRDYGFEDLQYFEKFEYRDYTHYSLYMSNYTPQRPYFLYYILEVDKVTLEEKSGFLKYIPDERMEVFDIREFTGTMELYNNEMQLFGGAVFSEGEITSNSIGTTTCYTEIVMIGHPCTYGGEHMPGEACNGENGNGISDAYYSFSSFTWCETEYDYSSPPGGFTGGAGGGPTLSRLQIFYLGLDQNQVNYLNQNPDIKAIIEDYVVRANGVATGEKMVDLGLSNSSHLQMVLDYIANNPDYTLENKNFIYFMVNFLTDNPNTTQEQFENWFMGEPEGMDGDYDAAYWEDPNLNIPSQNLPSWTSFNSAFPKKNGGYMPAEEVYQLVGGQLYNSHLANPSLYSNACAIRVSRALNYSGVTIPQITGQTEKGSDNKNYFKSARNLNAWMEKTFGTPTGTNHITGAQGGTNGKNFPSLLEDKKGIYIIVNAYPGHAGYTGHADIINNGTCNGTCNLQPEGGVAFINIWPLN